MDHLKEMFKFQLQSLEMVGCEMLFIVASSDGEFQVYGSSKGRQYSIEHPCLITDFVRYCQGKKNRYIYIEVSEV